MQNELKELKDMSLAELWQRFPIVLRAHNPSYSVWCNEEKISLVRVLGPHTVCRISHIGSTAVAGLLAKPVVDILLEYGGEDDMAALSNLLQGHGWVEMDCDAANGTLDLCKGYTPSGLQERVFHLHIKPEGDWNELYFRDYLRQHPDVARQYEELKSDLKKQFEHDRDAYTDGKSAFILRYTQKAREEFPGRYSSGGE